MPDKRKILVVEDDHDARTLLCMMLNSLGYETEDYDSGEAALANADKLTVNLAMLDIMMPEMDGFELLQKLKELSQFKEVPVIMVTAKDKDDDVMQGYNHGADYYITKPYTVEQIKYAVELYLTDE